MIVLVHAVKEENDGNAFTRVVVMIAAEKEAVWIRRIVVLHIVLQIQIGLVHLLAQRTEFSAHHG